MRALALATIAAFVAAGCMTTSPPSYSGPHLLSPDSLHPPPFTTGVENITGLSVRWAQISFEEARFGKGVWEIEGKVRIDNATGHEERTIRFDADELTVTGGNLRGGTTLEGTSIRLDGPRPNLTALTVRGQGRLQDHDDQHHTIDVLLGKLTSPPNASGILTGTMSAIEDPSDFSVGLLSRPSPTPLSVFVARFETPPTTEFMRRSISDVDEIHFANANLQGKSGTYSLTGMAVQLFAAGVPKLPCRFETTPVDARAGGSSALRFRAVGPGTPVGFSAVSASADIGVGVLAGPRLKAGDSVIGDSARPWLLREHEYSLAVSTTAHGEGTVRIQADNCEATDVTVVW